MVNKYDHKDTKDYCEITMTNDHGMQVKLLNYGATLEKVLLPIENGSLENVIMSLHSPEDYSKERNFLGGTVGRIVGRVRKGQWQHGSQIVQFPLNDGQNHAHGGQGTDTKVFSFKTEFDEQIAQTTLTLFDPAGTNNYPGNLKMKVTYTLDNDDRLSYEIKALSDELTVFNPTNHVYFRLDGQDTGIKDLQLKINSDFYLPLDKTSMPYQGRRSVDGTVFDLRAGKRIGDILDSDDEEIKAEGGLNHPFILRGDTPDVILTSTAKNRSMELTTKSPSVVVYTANHFDNTGIAKHIGQYDGVALEAQFPPQEGTDLMPITLMQGEQFETWTHWKFHY